MTPSPFRSSPRADLRAPDATIEAAGGLALPAGRRGFPATVRRREAA